MPEANLIAYANSGSYALGSNFFRYELLARGLGYWVDMDFYFLKELDFQDAYVFGWEHEHSINCAVLLLPFNSEMVSDLRDITRTNRCPPWFGPKRRASYYWNRVIKGTTGAQNLPWGTYGPGLVTYLARKYDVAKMAKPRSIFYPVRYQDARLLYGPAEVIEGMITPETKAVHMWHSKLFDLHDKPPPPGSYMDVVCRKHDIKTSGPN